jgi:hypothetical protein
VAGLVGIMEVEVCGKISTERRIKYRIIVYIEVGDWLCGVIAKFIVVGYGLREWMLRFL